MINSLKHDSMIGGRFWIEWRLNLMNIAFKWIPLFINISKQLNKNVGCNRIEIKKRENLFLCILSTVKHCNTVLNSELKITSLFQCDS